MPPIVSYDRTIRWKLENRGPFPAWMYHFTLERVFYEGDKAVAFYLYGEDNPYPGNEGGMRVLCARRMAFHMDVLIHKYGRPDEVTTFWTSHFVNWIFKDGAMLVLEGHIENEGVDTDKNKCHIKLYMGAGHPQSWYDPKIE